MVVFEVTVSGAYLSEHPDSGYQRVTGVCSQLQDSSSLPVAVNMLRIVWTSNILLVLSTFLITLLDGASLLKLPAQQKLGVSFSPAGLLTPYHLGASYELQKMGILTASTSVSGASGGALAAVTSALGIKHTDGLAACEYIAERCKVEGTRYTLKVALNKVLEDILPANSADILNSREAKCSLAYTGQFVCSTLDTVPPFVSLSLMHYLIFTPYLCHLHTH